MQIEPQDLLRKYVKGECIESEKALVERWYMQFNELETDITQHRIVELGEEIRSALSLRAAEVRTKRLWLVRTAVAAVFASLLGTVWFFFPDAVWRKDPVKEQLSSMNTAPGAGKAVLTTAGGKKIDLDGADKGVLLVEDGIQVIKLEDNKILYKDMNRAPESGAGLQHKITIPNGAQYQIVLSDDTKVWLDAATTLIFPIDFAEMRSLSLSGEAYFEVFKDKVHPFVVLTEKQRIEVLGTHFNVSAYADEKMVRTTLLEGTLRIMDPAAGQSAQQSGILLKPGEQAVSSGSGIRVERVDGQETVAWMKGEFVFRNERLEHIMLKVARWYDVEVEYRDKLTGSEVLGGSIASNAKLGDVLKMLEMISDVHFRISGKKVIVTR